MLLEIDEIYRYIAKDNPLAASDVLVAIRGAVEFLSHYPRKLRNTHRRGLRALPPSAYPYIIFYGIRRGDVEVVHVLHGARRHPGFQEEQIAVVQ
ncbi:MAG: type II toxin-antitoxin system RelE/ParE family toxin [Alphaproteobacteria bacterium]|nr:type II toxin-antitoxin system RelE/ParE family toxin [Alphaproteobacteria bacterium]